MQLYKKKWDLNKNLYRILPLFLSLTLNISFAFSTGTENQKPPKQIKPWEINPITGEVIKHPKNFGVLNFGDPSTWNNIPKIPSQGKTSHGIWLVGPGDKVVFGENVWKFRTPSGQIVTLLDQNISENAGKIVGKYKKEDGTIAVLTNLIGDMGHPTLAATIPGNSKLLGEIAGDYKIENLGKGGLSISFNNVSGRYMTDANGELVNAQKELEALRDKVAKIYKIQPSQIHIANFIGKPPKTRMQRFIDPLKSKGVVVISGGTNGIGKEVVKKFLDQGYEVATFGRDPAKVEALRKEFPTTKLRVESVSMTDHSALTKFVQNVEKDMGKISILINNAGISGHFGSIGNAPIEVIQETISTNLTGTMDLTSIVVKRMEQNKIQGVIVNMSSGASKGVKGASIYSASKAGVNAFSASVAQEYLEAGIKVFSFNPGHVDTDMQQLIRDTNPSDFNFSAKMQELKKAGGLVDPKETAQQLDYLIQNPNKFTPGTMVEYTNVADHISKGEIGTKYEVTKILPGHVLEKAHQEMDLVFSNLSKNKKFPAKIYFNNILLAAPQTVKESILALAQLTTLIENSSTPIVSIRFDNQVIKIYKKPLGAGMMGTVYEIVGSERVLKIAKPNSLAIKSLLEEKSTAIEIEQLVKNEKFLSPKTFFIDQHGLFGIKEKVSGQKLTDLLIEKGVIEIKKDANNFSQAFLNESDLKRLVNDPVLKEVSSEIENLIKLRRKYPDLISDLGPDNLFIIYKDQTRTKLQGLSLVDIGKSGTETKAKFDSVKNFNDYLKISEGLVNRYIKTGVIDIALINPHNNLIHLPIKINPKCMNLTDMLKAL